MTRVNGRGPTTPSPAEQQLSDSAKRACDTINTHYVALGGGLAVVGKWVAIRLSDGGSDGVLYDTRADAIRHQLHEMQCAYFCIPPGGVEHRGCVSFLRTVRRLYATGHRLSDPAHDPIGVIRVQL